MSVVQTKNLFSTNIENHNIDTRQRNNSYLPQTNLTIYQKEANYSVIKFFSNSSLEFKNVVGNLKKFKIGLTQFLYTWPLYTLEEYSNQSCLMYFSTKFLIILILDLRLCQCTLYRHSLIVRYVLITCPCIKIMSYLCIVFLKLLLSVFYCQDSFCTIPIMLMTNSLSILMDL